MIKRSLLITLLLFFFRLDSGITRIKNVADIGDGASFKIEYGGIFCRDSTGYIGKGATINLGTHGSCEIKSIVLTSERLNNDENNNINNYRVHWKIPNLGGSDNVDIYLLSKTVSKNASTERINNPEGWIVETDVTNGSPTFLNRLAGILEQSADSSKQLLVDVARLGGEIKGEDVISLAKSAVTGGVSDIAAAAGAGTQAIAAAVESKGEAATPAALEPELPAPATSSSKDSKPMPAAALEPELPAPATPSSKDSEPMPAAAA